VIWPFWLALLVKGEFITWTLGLALTLALLGFAFFVFPLNLGFDLALIVGMALAVVLYVFRWAREFLVMLVVDYDENYGNGLVIIKRLLPDPTLPETVQIPLQQAAEGSPEVNTRGLLNTIVSQLPGMGWLKALTIGDLTMKGPAAPFGLTMKNIRDPQGVRERMSRDWKKINAIKSRDKEDKERSEYIDRTTRAVAAGMTSSMTQLADSIALGIVKAQALQNGGSPPPTSPPPTQTPPPTEEPPGEPDSMEWEPVWSLRTARSAPLRALRPTPLGSAGGREELLRAKLVKKEKPESLETDEALEADSAEPEPSASEQEEAPDSPPAGSDPVGAEQDGDVSQSISSLEGPPSDGGAEASDPGGLEA
jgi:hypothetical protein